MNRIFIRAIPFMLALMIGVALDSFVSRFWSQSNRTQIQVADEVTRVSIHSVPDADFPEIMKRQRQLIYAHVRLEAVFDANGSIKSVRPFPMLPYGVTESAAGSHEFPDVTPFMVDSQFVDSLPHGLTELAIRQISEIDYSPRRVNGHSVPQRVTVITKYSYSESRFAVGCSNIDVTIMDDNGVLWSGNTWASRDRGCIVI